MVGLLSGSGTPRTAAFVQVVRRAVRETDTVLVAVLASDSESGSWVDREEGAAMCMRDMCTAAMPPAPRWCRASR